jgi:hypothetical protein
MADILATEVVYSHLGSQIAGVGRIRRAVRVTFPNAAGGTDYPAGGVPLTCNQLGFPKGVGNIQVAGRSVVAGDNNPNWLWNGDAAAPKLLAFGSRTITKQDAELSTAANDKVLVIATPQVLTLIVEGQ